LCLWYSGFLVSGIYRSIIGLFEVYEMAYYFVFQNKTYIQERDGEYLWAPQSNPKGHLRHHWTRVSAIRKDDIIIHSYKTDIIAFSIATTDARSAQIPPEIAEHQWDSAGWKVSVKYYEIPHPIQSQPFVPTLREQYPDKDGVNAGRFSPMINYLSAATRPPCSDTSTTRCRR
jgi:5-methylcytosine-specific restriction enzyme A